LKNRGVFPFYALGIYKNRVQTAAPMPAVKSSLVDPESDPIPEHQRISKEFPRQFNAWDTTTTEFATVDVDSVVHEIEIETTPKPDPLKPFGGFDLMGIFQAFFSGFFG
jgi:hypothetical protein